MTHLTLLTREGCHLCAVMRGVVARVQQQHPVSLTEIDISTQPDLEQRFSAEIPVLLDGDRVIARYRISVSQLVAILSGDG